MMDFCPSCGGIKSMSSDINLMNAHNRMCRCPQPDPAPATVSILSSGTPSTVTWNVVNALTEEQIREIVRDEVAKALVNVKQEIAREVPQEMAKQVRSKTGVRNNK